MEKLAYAKEQWKRSFIQILMTSAWSVDTQKVLYK